MSKLTEITAVLQAQAPGSSPSELAKLALQLCGGEMEPFFFINVFAEAFPDIPLQKLIRASRWHGMCVNGVSDEEFDEMLNPWLRLE